MLECKNRVRLGLQPHNKISDNETFELVASSQEGNSKNPD